MMNDLNLMLRFSSLDPTSSTEEFTSKSDKYLKIGNVNKLVTFLLIAIALVASFTVNYGSIANQSKQPVYFSVVGTSFYFLVAALLAAALLSLLKTLKTKFDDDLKLEIGTLLTFMIYFTITFCIRGGAMILVYPCHLWPQFNYTW